VGPRAGVDGMERCKFLILSGLELQPLRRRVRSQSLYRLRSLLTVFEEMHVVYCKSRMNTQLQSAAKMQCHLMLMRVMHNSTNAL
jgi:hypothetical protein